MADQRGKTVLCGLALVLGAFLVHGAQVHTSAASAATPGASSHTSQTSSEPATSWASDDDVDCAAVACIALTFDDGPSPSTAALLDELRAANVHATFFVVGGNVASRPDDVARAVAEGNEIGNHTWSHADLTKLTAEAISSQLTRTADAVQAAAGVRPTLVRPPYGAYDSAVDELVGGPEILWSVDPRDWEDRNSADIVQRVLDGAKPGAIVIMHDLRQTTVDALPAILAGLFAQGIHPVTVSRLLAGLPLVSGAAYSHRTLLPAAPTAP